MSTYIPKIKETIFYDNGKYKSKYCIVETEKVFELSFDDRFHLDEKKFINTVKEKYHKSEFYLSVDTMNKKLKPKGLFDSKRDNWYNLRNSSMFELTINEVINGFKLIEYDENEFNKLSFEVLLKWGNKKKLSRSRFGFGNENEGIFFTYSSYFCLFSNGKIKDGSFLEFGNPNNTFNEFDFNNNEISSFFQDLITIGISQYIDWENSTIDRMKSSENELSDIKNKIITQLDKDGNGEVDVIEGNDFNLLLKKHQKSIVEVDRNYVQQFVKISSYLKTKKGNIQSIFNSIKDIPNQELLNEYVEILKDEIHTYNLVLFNSLNMIVSLVEDDMITFYEIYEMFDKLNIFNSNWENELSQKLTNISSDINGLMNEIKDVGEKIVSSIDNLSYITEESTRILDNRLGEIDSSIKTNNLLTLIQTYQTYKINKNTKSLR